MTTVQMRWILRRRALGAAVLAMAALATAAAEAADADNQAVAIIDVRIVMGSSVIESGTVVFAGGKIIDVGAQAPVPHGAVVIDGRGKTLMPGLIDGHVHMADSYAAGGGLVLQQAAVYGVTTVLDLGSSDLDRSQAFKKRVKAGEFPQGADMYTAGPLATAPGGHGSGSKRTLTRPEEAKAWVDARVAAGSDYIKLVSETFAEHFRDVPTLSDETFAAVVSEAHRHGLLAVAHTLQQFRARRAVQAGVDGLVHISPYDLPDPDFGQLMAQHGVFQSTNLISYAHPAIKLALSKDAELAPYMPSWMIQGLANTQPFPDAVYPYGMAAFRMLHRAGVKIVAGTDIGYPYSPLLHAEIELMVQEGGMTPLEALHAATVNAASAYRLKDRGRIEPGLRADLLLVRGDPTRDIKATRAIDGVWAQGVWIDRAAYKAKIPTLKEPPRMGPP